MDATPSKIVELPDIGQVKTVEPSAPEVHHHHYYATHGNANPVGGPPRGLAALVVIVWFALIYLYLRNRAE